MSTSTDAKAALEQSKEGRHFLELITKCPDIQLATALIAAGAKLLTVEASGKENALPAPTAPDLSAALLTLKGLSFINPRGRFDLIFSKDALYLSNAKGNIVVPTTLLTHVAILDQIPRDTKKRCLLFLVLDRNGPSVMNGKQRLEVIIVQTLESDAINTRASTGEAMEGPVAAVLCQAVGMCVPNFTNFLAPDPELYRSARGHVAVHAVVKVSPGHLFPLPGALLFAERPALFLPHRDVLAVEYRRPQSATFDLVLHTQMRAGGAAEGSGGEGGGGGDAACGSVGGSVQQVEFSQIDRGELGRLQSYFSASRIKLYDPAAPPGRGGGGPSGAARGGAGAGPSGAAAGGVGGGADYHDEEDEDEDEDEDFDPTSFERLESGRRPAKRLRSEPSGSVAASNLQGAAAAGPGGSRDVQMGELVAEGGESEEEEDEEEDEEEMEDEEEEEDESSYDEEDELADLEDEDDLRADDVRQRVRQTGGGGGGGSAAAGGGPSSGRGGAPTRGGRKAAEEEDEEEEEEYDDDDDE